jgi:GTPase Era involved in 16S rRNA processing
MDFRETRLRAVAELESVRSDIDGSSEILKNISLWRPAAGLRQSCIEGLAMLDRLSERFDRKLVVTIVGPSGSGKSTLLNALGRKDDLSRAGTRRPTTKNVVVLCKHASDAEQLKERLGPDEITIHTDDAAEALENLILIDTPDTDSTHLRQHIPIVHKSITLSDVLICVFDGENPKRRDHTDFMAPYVTLFSGSSLVVAVNKCDRLSESELTETIMPEFAQYIKEAWHVEPARIFCISARRHLESPSWDPQARPKHSRDQFEQLKQLIVETFNRSGYSVDRRIENAKSIRTTVERTIREASRKDGKALGKAIDLMARAEKEAMNRALDGLQGEGEGLFPGINVRLYQRLSQRWLGPVGWLVAVWARILVFGTGIASIFRFGNPVRQVFGAISAVKQYSRSKKETAKADLGVGADTALHRYDACMARLWPDIAENLIDARFVPSVREMQTSTETEEKVGRHLSRLWGDALENELSRLERRLSTGVLQLLFNLPVLGVLGYTGWLTAVNFFTGNILSGDFFLHAFWTIVLVLLLSFFLLQGVIRLTAGKDRIVEHVFTAVRETVESQDDWENNPVRRQATAVLRLGR